MMEQQELRHPNSHTQPRTQTHRAPQSARKVKLLCSFGGKILLRPTDGALRYVGGHTRIVSVKEDIPFDGLIAKLSEVCGGGANGAVVLKYQLPNEDLDALITVSCDEDLENMMEEYEKLVESDPSAKIRAFLFSPSENSPESVGIGGLGDGGQKYFEAVNGMGIGGSNESGGSSVGSLKRKDSGLSAGSSNNCGIDAVDEAQTLNFVGQGYSDPNQVQFLNNHVTLVPLHVNDAQVGNLKAGDRPALSQLPPLPPLHQNAHNVDGYGLNSQGQGQGVRLDDCYMCQKMLPHAHSDGVVQNLGNGSPGMVSEVSPTFHSQRSGDTRRPLAPSLYLGDNVIDVQCEEGRTFVPKKENVDQSSVLLPPGSTGLLPDGQTSYGLFLGNFPESQNTASPQYPIGNDVGLVRNGEGLPEFANEHARAINGMMEGFHLSPTQGNAAVIPDTSSHLVVDGAYGYMPQVGGNVMLHGIPFANAGVVQQRNYVRPTNQMPPTTADLSRMHNFQGPFPNNLGVRVEPPMPSEGLLAMPTNTSNIDRTYGNRQVNNIPTGDVRGESSQFHSNDLLCDIVVPQTGNVTFGLSNAISPTGHLEAFQEPSPSDSLFCNQDPRKIVGGAHPLPPKPRRVASRESIAPKDTDVQVHLGNSTESDIIALLEEGGLHPSPDSLNKKLHIDPTQPMKEYKVLEDEQIKQDLQAVAEGVASSVLNSSLFPDPVFFARETKETNPEANAEMQKTFVSPERKLEDNKSKVGLHITEDIGRLQIIKNSDLEELRELGSGTFGTVYHGKWRGSDVAIKRINDRCFAGKPSEQEKMRADFWNEACKLADLHHPNVVAFYGVVLDGPGGSVATVTEYMVNGSLRNVLQRNDKTLDRRKRLLIAMDVAFGMEYLHGKNIVHFDLKSDNLLVNLRDPQRPICKVGDLGLSKVKCQTLISGGVRGTLPWMAPELLNGSSSLVSEKVDVFSFGIVMWELLTGEEPYADLHYGAIIGGIVSNTLRPPVPESCDREWRALMERCWSADPSERPSFTEVAERLRSMASSLAQKGQANAQVQK